MNIDGLTGASDDEICVTITSKPLADARDVIDFAATRYEAAAKLLRELAEKVKERADGL